MKIDKIKKLSNGKYKLTFEDNSTITTYDEVLLKSNILYSKKVDDVNTFLNENSYYDLYNKVIKLISKKLRSRYEVEEFLKKNNASNDDINSIINSLINNGYINDEAFTKAYIYDRFNLSNDGLNKIKNDLVEYHINENIIDKYINLVDKKDIVDKVNKLVNKKVKLDHKHSKNIIKMKVKQDLINLGYDSYDIENALNNVTFDNTIDKEYMLQYNKLSKKYSGYDLENKLKQKLLSKGYSYDEINAKIKELGN